MPRITPCPGFRVLIHSLAVAVAVTVMVPLLPADAGAARHQMSSACGGSNDETEAIVNATQGEGDLWGGEQSVVPPVDPGPVLVPTQESRLDSGAARWLVRLASLFAWLSTSQWFSNLE